MSTVAAGAAREARFDTDHPGLVIGLATVLGTLICGVAAGRGLLPGLGALLAVGAALWAVSHPRDCALVMVAVVPAISGLARGLPVPGLRLAEVVAVGTSALLIATAKRDRWRRWRAFDWIALAYVAATFGFGYVNAAVRGETLTADDLGQLVGPLLFFLIYRAVLVTFHGRADRARAVEWLLLGSIPVTVLAILQAAGVPAVQALLITLTGEDYSYRDSFTLTRVNGPFPHWTMLAGYLFAVIVICSALLLCGVRDRRRTIVLAALVPAAIALVLTVTIAPMIGAVVGALLLAYWCRRSGKAIAYVAVGTAGLAFAFTPLLERRADDQFGARASSTASYSFLPVTVSNRVDFWRYQYLPALEGRWMTGYGAGIPPDVTWKHTESVYITMLLRGGLPLLALYAALMAATAITARRVGAAPDHLPAAARAGPSSADAATEIALGRAMFVLVVLLAVIQFIVPYFTTTGLPHLWWILAALVASAATDERLTHRRGG